MERTDIGSFYLYKISPLEGKALNLTIRKLLQEKDIGIKDGQKLLSGQKVKLKVSKNLLWKWHRDGILTIIHGRVRLANFSLYCNIIDEQNAVILRERFSLTQKR